MSTTVEMRGVTKVLGGSTVVDALDLEVPGGEFFSILGPSGCGKTTTLRMLAGFLIPDAGTIALEGRNVTKTPPYRRDVNTVFQSYALFGHLSVEDNVAFGLKRKRVPRAEITKRVADALEMVSLGGRAKARPADLSGGQKQRVALARALVNMPKLLLLDEPLGALDLQLRRQMQSELKRIQREVGITFIFVTHDQDEALAMSDRIAVMREGRFEQVGSPADIYERPVSRHVARFMGNSNVLDVTVGGSTLTLADGTAIGTVQAGDTPIAVSLRPERIRFSDDAGDDPRLPGVVVDAEYTGVTTQYLVRVDSGHDIKVVDFNRGAASSTPRAIGDRVVLTWHSADAVLLHR